MSRQGNGAWKSSGDVRGSSKNIEKKALFLFFVLLLRRVSRSVVGCAKRTRPEEMEPHLSMQSDPYVNWEKKGAH